MSKLTTAACIIALVALYFVLLQTNPIAHKEFETLGPSTSTGIETNIPSPQAAEVRANHTVTNTHSEEKRANNPNQSNNGNDELPRTENVASYEIARFPVFVGRTHFENGVERFSAQNGISSWGVDYEKFLSDYVSREGVEIADYDFECRISVCLFQGKAESRDQIMGLFDAVVEKQEYGIHGDIPDSAKNGEFYIVIYEYTPSSS